MPWTNLVFTIGQVLTAADVNQLQDNIKRVRISDKGPTSPPLPSAGTRWIDDSQPIWQEKIFDGAGWVPSLFLDSAVDRAGPVGAGVGRHGDYIASTFGGEKTEFAGMPYTPKNMLLNADMRYWQRGSSYHVSPSSTAAAPVGYIGQGYIADRWLVRLRTLGSLPIPRVLVSQSSSRPEWTGVYSSIELRVVSIRPTMQNGDLFQIEQMIEGTMGRRAQFGSDVARYTRLSFYFWSSVTGRFSVNIANNSRDVTWTRPVDITVGSVWTYCNVGFERPVGGFWDYDEDVGIRVGLTFAAGDNYRTSTPAAWVYNSPDVRTVSGQLNGLTAVGATFRLTAIQYELGEQATPLELLDATIALNMLRRYFWKTFPLETQIGSNRGYVGALSTVADTDGIPTAQVRLPVAMLRQPIVATYCPFAANTKWWRQSAAAVGADGTGISTNREQIWLSAAGFNTTWAGQQMAIHASADAEFYTD